MLLIRDTNLMIFERERRFESLSLCIARCELLLQGQQLKLCLKPARVPQGGQQGFKCPAADGDTPICRGPLACQDLG